MRPSEGLAERMPEPGKPPGARGAAERSSEQRASGQSALRVALPERILQRLEWKVIRRLDGLLQGDYRSLFYGYGVDFADLREYQPGDDVRYIDWNVTARMDSPYVRQYVEDREITAWFLVDLSPSMDYGTDYGTHNGTSRGIAQTDKRAMLIDLVGTLGRVLTRHGNRVGAIIYNGQGGHRGAGSQRVGRVIPARGGRNHVLWLIDEVVKQPRLASAPLTDLHLMLEGALSAIKRRSLVFVVSDFISQPGWESALSLLQHRHEVLAVRLYDPSEVELPDVGAIWLEDAETGEQLYVDTHDVRFRARFGEMVREREQALNTAFRRAGVEPWTLSTGEDLVRSIVRYAEARRRVQRGQSSLATQPAVVAGKAGR
jgi:uncharacterized protein (DUF58 family)